MLFSWKMEEERDFETAYVFKNQTVDEVQKKKMVSVRYTPSSEPCRVE
jgi:hypothetical protein